MRMAVRILLVVLGTGEFLGGLATVAVEDEQAKPGYCQTPLAVLTRS
jgi:hypothetical protein